MKRALNILRLPVVVLGVLLLFVTDRYLMSESYHLALRVISYALLALAPLMTLLLGGFAGREGRREEAKGWRYCASWQLGLLVGLGLYGVYAKVLGDAGAPDSPSAKILLGAWLVLTCLSLFAGLGLEWAMRESGRGVYAEPQRVCRGGSSWLAAGLLFAALVAINYAANRRDVSGDWSYLKVRTPTESTMKMIGTLTKPMTIALFFPPGNEVKGLVADYFSALAGKESRIKLENFDKDMNPTQAETMRVSRNGQVVLDIDGKRSRIDIGTNLAKAKKTLKDLDKEFQKSFLEITSDRKSLYFTRGHGEASWVGNAGDNPLKSLKMVEEFLRQQNYSTRLFGIADGSATAVPDDAAAVVIVGPTSPFSAEETQALKTYVEGGGNLMVFLDTEKGAADEVAVGAAGSEQTLFKLLAEAGIKVSLTPLANDKNHVAATRSRSDNWFIFTNVFTSHESVTSLARHDERIALLLFQAGYLSVTPELGKWRAFETVRTLSDTYADANRNFAFDKDSEKQDAYVVGAVAELKGAPKAAGGKKNVKNGRILVLTDATALSDALVRNTGNALYFADGLKWLVGESELAGEIATEDDVKIRHTRKEDVVWFHGTVIVMPLLVLGVGFIATRRKRSSQGRGTAGEAKGSGDAA